MKKATLTIALLVYVFVSYSQSPITENEKLASLCKVWGFLKYYHPTLSKGTIDWDKELMNRVDPVLALNNKEEISNYLINEVQNGFSGTKIVNFNNGVPTEEQQTIIQNKVKSTLTGSKGKKVIVAFNSDETKKTTVDDIPLNDAPEHYKYL